MSRHEQDPIAVIGSACRFAGEVSSPSELWRLLETPRDVRSQIPDNRFRAKGFHHADGLHHGHCNVEHSYLLSDDPRAFDAQFFGVKPVEAKALDPQQRMLLEIAYEGLESAGLPMEMLRGSNTGVFVGLMCGDYEALLLRDFQSIPTYHSVGTARSIMSNRISYFFDFHGPSVTIDTACSSSLVAVHLATRALRAGDARVALACGSNLLLGPENYVAESKLKMLSPDGRSRMWDQDANGYARGDGVAVLVLKTLAAALQDGDAIECVIRETGVNHDGATQGITMPSATAQVALIRDTYARAGLDLAKEEDRCQYFEAHGTGTPAGDPVEAEAIQRALGGDRVSQQHPLYVGSVKTVLGHTEGTAGIAGILKASLALQAGRIPPNLLFHRLSPRIAPFYTNLEVPTVAKPWPEVATGKPRRASVNSFGFGGANAHAILESFDASRTMLRTQDAVRRQPFAPFVFSAGSEKSLRALLSSYAEMLSSRNEPPDARDLAWTLFQRKSALPFRTAFPGGSAERLAEAIHTKLQAEPPPTGTKSPASSASKPMRILAIFTGQGAQYARMGAELIETSPFARRVIQGLEAHLSQLPEDDRPSWSLEAELLAEASSARLHEAVVSQPLCTAVQILLVKLLRAAHVKLDGLVGHSSGEIAAAYAAGYISSRDAMCIAYYRGLHCQLAAGPGGRGMAGAMLAVGTTVEDASSLCGLPEFAGRAGIAAVNSSSSLTLSGDSDAIGELENIFEDEKKFKRLLRVDKAYHSHHMLPCSEPYAKSLRACNIQVLAPPPVGSGRWYSSVYEGVGDEFDKDKLADSYWVDNMIRPVLFSQAIATAVVASAPFDIVLEIGAHPALKGPVSQNLQELLGQTLPYSSMLSRGVSATEAASSAMGFLWVHLPRQSIDLTKYEEMMSDHSVFSLIKGLPTYPWNHETKYWHESRISRNFRQRRGSVHSLLGDITPDSSPHHLSWRNLLRTRELEWLPGHQLQNQTVFPAAGYLASALEASRALVTGGREIQLIELDSFVIHHSIAFDDDDTGVETLISLTEVSSSSNEHTTTSSVRAKFTYSAALGREPESLTLAASGMVHLRLGGSSPTVLPKRGPSVPHMIDVETNRFYSALANVGYSYSGAFQGLSSLKRKLGHASGLIKVASLLGPKEEDLLVHPATLDCALQSIILAYSYPNDGRLWSLHVPTSFSRLRVNPCLCSPNWSSAESVAFDSIALDGGGGGGRGGILGDVDIFGQEAQNVAIQLEGMRAVPFAEATSATDKKLFSFTSWRSMYPDEELVAHDDVVTEEEEGLAYILERIATFFTRKFDQELPLDHPARSQRPFSDYLTFCCHVNELQRCGKHTYAKKEWLNDTLDDILASSARYAQTPDVRIMRMVGEQMPRVFRGETTILEHLRPNNLLDDYYVGALGFPKFSKWLGRTVKQIAHRYPHMNVLEIGAGTGGATKSILRMVGNDFASYTFTDISSGFFEMAQSALAEYEDRMTFRTFDANRDPVSQGFAPGSYDLIVASFVIHATEKLEITMRNLRRLLRPGGFVAVAESTNNDQTRAGFIFGTLPGWWAGADEGRVLSPCVSAARWDAVLKNSGFSGIDSVTPEHFERIYAGSVFVSQAVDDRVSFLREPLAADLPPIIPTGEPLLQDLIILGGSSLRVARLITSVEKTLKRYSRSITVLQTLSDVDARILADGSTVLSLIELDAPIFADVTPADFGTFKSIFQSNISLLWVTSGRRADDAFSNMVAGFGRTAVHEVPELHLQLLDFEAARDRIDARELSEALLQFRLGGDLAMRGGGLYRSDLLWSVEPEVVVDAEGRRLIPRQEMRPDANERYNSERRPITRPIILDKRSAVVLKKKKSGSDYYYFLNASSHGTSPSDAPDTSEATIELETTLGTVTALRTRLGHRFLALGINRRTGTKHVALTESLASLHCVPANATVPYKPPVDCSDAQALAQFAAALISSAIAHSILPGQTVLVHNPTHLIATSVHRRLSAKGAHAIFTTDLDLSNDAPPSWTRLSPCMPRRDVQRLVPMKEVSGAWEIPAAAGRAGQPSAWELLLSLLPVGCRVETADTIFSDQASPILLPGEELSNAIAHSNSEEEEEEKWGPQPIAPYWEPETISLADIAKGVKPTSPLSMVSWDCSSPLPVRVTRLDTKPLLRADRTYWLVGLSGTLGLSLSDWMIAKQGARYLVISSRNPAKIDPAWIEMHRQKGVIVELFASDVTNEEDVKALYSTISHKLPPVAGVVHGAMVLRDTVIRDMSFEQMTDVLKPRVQGTLNLDRILNRDLEFFILLSSMTGVIGNMGQANYTTANAFMSSLAANRRKRGLAASVVNVGVIVGAGYVTREVSNMDETRLDRGGMMRMSETDFHQMIAEAIETGRPGSHHDPEVSTGLREIPENSPFLPTWHDNPKFSRFVLRESANGGDKGAERTGLSVQQRLQAAEVEDEVRTLIKGEEETLGAKLRAVLQMDTDDDSLLGMRTDEIGLDSLIAVDIRSWFLKNYEVGIPVLKILGGAGIADLVEQALDELPISLVPNLKRHQSDSPRAQTVGDVVSSQSPPDSSVSSSGSDSILSPPAEAAITEPSVGSVDVDVDVDVDVEAEPMPRLHTLRSASLSFSQSMFWFVHALTDDKTTLNHTGLFRLTGNLRVDDMRRAVKAVGQQHEALRTCFRAVDDTQGIVQSVLHTGTLRLEQARVDQDSDIKREFEAMKAHIYDLASGQVMRIRLLTQESPSAAHYLLVGCHHINVDGISQQVLLADLEKAYRGQALDHSVLQYPEYAARQRADAAKGAFADDISFWKQEFATVPDPLPLTRSRAASRQPLAKYVANRLQLRVESALADRIRRVSREHRATAFHFYLTAFEMLLYRLTGARDFSIGIADGNRKDEETIACFGPLVNLVPTRYRVTPRTFGQELSENRAKTYAALAHSRLPFEMLLSELRVARSPTHSPIFQAFIDYRQGTKEKSSLADLELELLDFEPGRTAYDLSIDIIDNPGRDASISVIGQGSLYSKTDMQAITDSYEDILVDFSLLPQKRITHDDWQFRDAYLKRSLEVGRGTSFTNQWPDTLLHRLAAVVQQNRQKTAVTTAGGMSCTYEELEKRMDAIAQTLLLEGGVLPGDRVAIYEGSGCDWVASMLAVLKIGAVHVPLDPRARAARLAAVVADCQPAAVLVDGMQQSRCRDLLGASNTFVLDVASAPRAPLRPIQIVAAPDGPAIVLYTSGSTGTPKGVLLKHSNLRHEVEVSAQAFGLKSDAVILQQSSFSFDMSMLQMLLALSLGGTLCMVSEDMRGDPLAITGFMVEQHVSFTCATPSEYASWLRYGDQDRLRRSSWTAALSGGESVTDDLLSQFRTLDKHDLRLFNGYGPTETTCCSTKTELRYRDKSLYTDGIPVGRASPNESIYILDEQMRLLPIGLPGEIAIGGVGVAAGYLHHHDQVHTNPSFVHDKYASPEYEERGWTTMYRTRDRGRLLGDGSLLVEGRIEGDTEIKLRGMRVDLRDVERAVMAVAGGTIAEVVVSVPSTSSADSDAQALVGHIVFAPGRAPADQASYLRRLVDDLPLPAYMCPYALVPVDQLPKTSSSKLDRHAVRSLPITLTQAGIQTCGPQSPMEARLKALWLEVLRLPGTIGAVDIHPESDFFHVGGTSMLLVEVQAKIRRQLGLLVPLIKLFHSSTLKSMARLLNQSSPEEEEEEDEDEDEDEDEEEEIDWDVETNPAPNAQYPVLRNPAPAAAPPKVVVLTGASGNLGRHILQQLLETPEIVKIVYIAVRQLQQKLDAGSLPRADGRISYYEGDLRSPLLGLAPADCEAIFGEADALIHNGADVSHLKSYSTLRAANVASTGALAHLCAARRIPIHYVSSAQVAMLRVRDVFGEGSARDAPPPVDGSDGYAASKWASERMLERMSDSMGLRVWIHRPSSIIMHAGDPGEEKDDAPADLIHAVLQYSRKLKAVPVSENLRGMLDFVSVENASAGIVSGVVSGAQRADSKALVHYVHHTGDLQIPLRGMKKYLEEKSGDMTKYVELPIGEWAAKAERAGLGSMEATVIGNVRNLGMLMFPKLVKGNSETDAG